jgi:hypothetical protein
LLCHLLTDTFLSSLSEWRFLLLKCFHHKTFIPVSGIS